MGSGSKIGPGDPNWRPLRKVGETSEKPEPKGYVVYHLEYKDGSIDLNLSYVHRAYLCFLAERGGEAHLNYKPLNEEQRTHLRELIKIGLLAETPIVGHTDLVLHRLSDGARNVVDAIRKAGGP